MNQYGVEEPNEKDISVWGLRVKGDALSFKFIFKSHRNDLTDHY